MRLSEAIRLGAMLHPQCFNELYWMAGADIVASCALGAAEQAGFSFLVPVADAYTRTVACPRCPTWHCNVLGIVQHLNDWHRWPRQRIADFVETLEPQPAVDAVDPHADSSTHGRSTRDKASSLSSSSASLVEP